MKNAVIVPTGAKGGFVPKMLDSNMDRNTAQATAVSAYQEYIGALLDLTDNYIAGELVPANVVALDAADPYLVVAADKGTATFSDFANEISIKRGYWLGDAFASGGSNGYDHKAMGITARGAFESVKHHFSLLQIDPMSQPISVVGIGDMSGDVFGNGMLLSENIRLVAAFDHRDIFLDPNPDLAAAFAERQRLFDTPRSSWADYRQDLISSGGGVFSRSAKSIELSPEMQEILDCQQSQISPADLISVILRAPVDLLWNGGIGTYVKAANETHLQVGDKANDAIRIDANQLRVRVVGEGGNLGFTQAARIEAALHGVAINTDAIDNSAGVDTSDHEVNLKILLNQTPDENLRNQLLQSLTSDVADAVLLDNIQQNAVLTQAAHRSDGMASVHARMMQSWQNRGLVDLELEGLPTETELFQRAKHGKGLVKPELAVLLAHGKLQLQEILLQSEVLNGGWAEKYLVSYFPEKIQKSQLELILQHPLRREIIATVAANRIVNLAGISAIWRAAEETGANELDIALAYLFAFEIIEVDAINQEIAKISWQNSAARIALSKEIRRYQDRVVRWVLANRSQPGELFHEVAIYRDAIAELRGEIGNQLRGAEAARYENQTRHYQSIQVPADLANLVAGLLDEYAALDLIDLKLDQPLLKISSQYFEVSDLFAGDRILNLITALPRTDVWEAKARAALRADMYSILAVLTASSLRMSLSMPEWRAKYHSEIFKIQELVTEIESLATVDIAALSVLLRSLRNFVNQIFASVSTSN